MLFFVWKSEELQSRLKKLATVAEKKEYEELVKDITPKKAVEEPFSSYKDQLGFGQFSSIYFFEKFYLTGFVFFIGLVAIFVYLL